MPLNYTNGVKISKGFFACKGYSDSYLTKTSDEPLTSVTSMKFNGTTMIDLRQKPWIVNNLMGLSASANVTIIEPRLPPSHAVHAIILMHRNRLLTTA